MRRIPRKRISVLAAGVLLGLMTGVSSEAPAAAQVHGKAHEELVERLLADGLTREEMVGLYEALAPAQFQPPACVAGMEMFDDVPAANPFCAWIEELARRDVTSGCGDGNYCPGNSVTRGQMAVFIVRATADEASHVVGEAGEPAFGNGEQGDCLWLNSTTLPYAPVSFYKDSNGIVHLAGAPIAVNGSGGDMVCGGAEEDNSDFVIFELPAGYQPEHLRTFLSGGTADGIFVAPEGGMMSGEVFIPGGSVLSAAISSDGNIATLDGITFRAAPETTTSSLTAEPMSVSLEALREMFE